MSFPRIRVNGWLYVDKTRYLRPLEEERYVFFIRPRRFGKSCWLSLLECYYGRHWAHEFEGLFGGTDVGRSPTAERGRYVVVRFDFSAFNDKLETLEERFEGHCFIDHRSLGGQVPRGRAELAQRLGACDPVLRVLAAGLHDQRDREPEQHGASGGSHPRALPQRPRGDEAGVLGVARGAAQMASATSVTGIKCVRNWAIRFGERFVVEES